MSQWAEILISRVDILHQLSANLERYDLDTTLENLSLFRRVQETELKVLHYSLSVDHAPFLVVRCVISANAEYQCTE